MQIFSKPSQKNLRILAASSFTQKDAAKGFPMSLKHAGVSSQKRPCSSVSLCDSDASTTAMKDYANHMSPNLSLNLEKQLSLISDPLWKRVCLEVVRMMGPIAVQIFQVEVGLPQEKSMNLYCHTEELASFVRTYSFVILASLQHYFPSLKTLNVQTQACSAPL